MSNAKDESDKDAAPRQSSLRPDISKIIDSGKVPDVSGGSVWPVVAMGLLSGLFLWLCFTPVDFAPVAWISIVPLCVLLRIEKLPRRSYRALWVCGFIWAAVTLQWMRLGHVAMYGALAALSFYVSM